MGVLEDLRDNLNSLSLSEKVSAVQLWLRFHCALGVALFVGALFVQPAFGRCLPDC